MGQSEVFRYPYNQTGYYNMYIWILQAWRQSQHLRILPFTLAILHMMIIIYKRISSPFAEVPFLLEMLPNNITALLCNFSYSCVHRRLTFIIHLNDLITGLCWAAMADFSSSLPSPRPRGPWPSRPGVHNSIDSVTVTLLVWSGENRNVFMMCGITGALRNPSCPICLPVAYAADISGQAYDSAVGASTTCHDDWL